MVELALLAMAVVSVVAFGRARGGSVAATVTGLAAAGGYFILRYALPGLIQSASSDSDVFKFLLPWGWVVAVMLFARFGLGRKRAKPGQHWVCPKCNSLNREYAVVCETCDQPYSEPAEGGDGQSRP
jgi:hypothetical protein